MSYFDTDIYNYENLKAEDKKHLDIYDMAVQDALNKDFIINDMMGLGMDPEEDSTIDKIRREVAEEVFEHIEQYLATRRLELIVSIMDGYPEEDTAE